MATVKEALALLYCGMGEGQKKGSSSGMRWWWWKG